MLSKVFGRSRSISPLSKWAWNELVICAVATVDVVLGSDGNVYLSGRQLPFWLLPTFTVVLYQALLLRRKYPRAVFVLMWVNTLAALPLLWYAPFAGLFVALYTVARRSATPWAVVALGVCSVPAVGHSYVFARTATDVSPAIAFIGNMTLIALVCSIVWGLGRVSYDSDRRVEQERAEHQERSAAAVRAERLHLARELHDIVSHSVSAMILQAAGARTLVPLEHKDVHNVLETIQSTGVEAMGELHRLLNLLRAADTQQDLNPVPTSVALADLEPLLGTARAAGVDVDVMVEGKSNDLDQSVGLTAYRIVQEALTNTTKHAGPGASCRIHLRWDPEMLTITVRDREGLEKPKIARVSTGHGLAGLAERVTLVGGTLEAGPVDGGFLVKACLPMKPPTATSEEGQP